MSITERLLGILLMILFTALGFGWGYITRAIRENDKVTKNCITLDDIKAEIKAKEMVETNIERQFYNMALGDVIEVLDNIGKAESEE